jgi:hypothetical protein
LRFRICRKPAEDDVIGSALDFYGQWFSPWGLAIDGIGQLDLETSSWPDGDYDLITQAQNYFTPCMDWWNPTWFLDCNPDFDTDEKYLKTIGTWYDSDRDWHTDTNKGGKVITDNTPPIVEGLFPLTSPP